MLGLALYGQVAASTRYRLGQFAPGLAAEHGIKLETSSLLGDEYLRRRFNGEVMPWAAMLAAGWARLAELRKSKHDLMMLHCELFPLMPAVVERKLLGDRPYIYDFDDAFYLKYRTGRLSPLRPLLGSKFDSVMTGASAITAGNRALADYAGKFNGATTVLPTVVDTGRYVPSGAKRGGRFTVGWIGSPSTAPYLEELAPALRQLGAEGAVTFVVIGGKAPVVPGVDVHEVEWSEATEVELINSFDVGVMPLPDSDWARGKCAFKLIQYMACGVPVVGTAVGANHDVVTSDCGFLAGSDADWLNALRTIRDDPVLSRALGDAGRSRAEEHFSLRRNLPVLAAVIRKAADGGG